MRNITLKQIVIIVTSTLVLLAVMMAVALLESNSKVRELEVTWKELETELSEKERITKSIQAMLGYGGMIHEFKNMVLRQDLEHEQRALQLIHTLLILIDQYRQLDVSDDEVLALDDIEQVLRAYEAALERVAKEIVRGGHTIAKLDQIARVDDSRALQGLAVLRLVQQSRHMDEQGLSKSMLLADLRASLGYGNMIHNFKNYILRRKPQQADAAASDLDRAQLVIDQYKSKGLTVLEADAIADIEQVLRQYRERLSQARVLLAENKSIREINEAVRVDGAAALHGMTVLDREVMRQISENTQAVSRSFSSFIKFNEYLLFAVVLLVVFLISFSIVMVNNYIAAPIRKISEVMIKLARGEMNVSLTMLAGKNELGEMVKSIAIFKKNELRRLNAERDLQLLNNELSQQIESLQEMQIHSDEQTQKALMLAESLAVARDEAFESSIAAQHEKEKAQAIIDTVSDGIVIVDEQTRIVALNPAAEEIFGYTFAELKNKPLDNLVPMEYRKHRSHLSRYMVSGRTDIINLKGERREVKGVHKDGSILYLEVSLGETKAGGQRLFTSVIRDITEKKAFENMKKEFVSTVSHELRTPLTAIKGTLGLVTGSQSNIVDDEKKHELLNMTARNVRRLELLINDILDIEKIEADAMTFDIQPIKVDGIVRDAVEDNQHYAVNHGVTLALTSTLDGVDVDVDEVRMAQIMANLISNAAKFSPAGGEVGVAVSMKGGKVRFSVSDRGPGIPENYRSKIFDRFTQADSTDSRQQGGTGLGMAITKALVDKMNGDITFETEEGQGTTFHVDLPLSQQGEMQES